MEHLDFYGTSYSLNTLGKSSYKTVFSFLSSMITLTLVGIGAWLMGRDFFFKLNPKVINSTVIPDESEPVFINNRNFTFAFRIEDESERPVADDLRYAFPYYNYYIYKRDEDGLMSPVFNEIYNAVPCLETEAKDNPMIQKFNPETLFCFDLEKIKEDLKIETDIDLYGGFDENYFSGFLLYYTNCEYKNGEPDLSTCVSFDQVTKRAQSEQYLSIYLPRVTFSPEDFDEPIKTYYDNVYYTMNPFTDLNYFMRYSLYTLNDDQGWIFEDIKQTVMVDLTKEEKEFRFLAKEAFDNNSAYMITIDLNFQRKQIKAKRVYIKIQELAASLGGIMKLVFFIFNAINKTYNKFKIQSILLEKYSKPDGIRNATNNSSLAAVKAEKAVNRTKLTFKEYLLLRMKCGNNLKAKKIALEQLNKQLDIENLLKFSNSAREQPIQEDKHITRIQVLRNG